MSHPRNWFTKLVYLLSRRRFGQVLLPLKLHALSTPRLAGMGAMMGAQKVFQHLDPRFALLAQARVAVLVGCSF